MRKLLNTIYVTNEQMYLMLDGENLVCKAEGEIKLRIPFENVENIVCFSYLGCSPALMGKCVEKLIFRKNNHRRFGFSAKCRKTDKFLRILRSTAAIYKKRAERSHFLGGNF